MGKSVTDKPLFRFGLVVTVAYVLAVGWWLVWPRWAQLFDLEEMRLNMLGDFFAGIFGPLAFLWLVLGFIQQGIELRQNTETLKLQAVELEKSVKHQEALVEVTREQVKAELEALRQERE